MRAKVTFLSSLTHYLIHTHKHTHHISAITYKQHTVTSGSVSICVCVRVCVCVCLCVSETQQ